MIRKTFSVPPLGCNCSIIGDPITKQAIVVDPGGAPERILQEVRAMGLTVVSIVHTHAGHSGDAVPHVRRALCPGATAGLLVEG